jgi:hypothetical protein
LYNILLLNIVPISFLSLVLSIYSRFHASFNIEVKPIIHFSYSSDSLSSTVNIRFFYLWDIGYFSLAVTLAVEFKDSAQFYPTLIFLLLWSRFRAPFVPFFYVCFYQAKQEWRPHLGQANSFVEWWYVTTLLHDTAGNQYMLFDVIFKYDSKQNPFVMTQPEIATKMGPSQSYILPQMELSNYNTGFHFADVERAVMIEQQCGTQTPIL